MLLAGLDNFDVGRSPVDVALVDIASHENVTYRQ